jgi:hypothetical protein
VPTLILLALVVWGLYQCTGGGFGLDRVFGPPDELPLSRYEDFTVGVWFTYPGGHSEQGKTVYLGETKGASMCGAIARAHASSKGLATNRDWGYVCCTHEAGSNCYRKIR